MRLPLLLKADRFCRKLIQTESISTEYQQWRHRFVLKRLRLMLGIAIIVWIVDIIVDTTIFIPSMNSSHPKYDFVHQNYQFLWGVAIIQLLQFLVAWLLLKISFFRQYPLLVFLWLTSALFITRQIFFTIFLNQIELAENSWTRIFPIMAILMPVRWRWYFLAQGVVLGHFGISYLAFGLREPSVEYGIDYFDGVYNATLVFLIINLGVFLYERLLQQEFELRRQLRLFLHAVSHDLRSPVLGTMFLLKSLRDPNAKETVVANEAIDRVVDSSDRQLRLIDSLLEAHNTEVKGIAVRPRPVCINSLVESVISEMQPLLARQRVTTTTKIPVKLPLVNIDPLQVRRVYENLIANALEYNRAGLHLTFKVEKDYFLHDKQLQAKSDRWIHCSVSDDGEGIPPQQHSQLFDLYTRASNSKQSLGVGLGLYICRQIINAHGGQIDINRTRKGASFWFTLPIVKSNV